MLVSIQHEIDLIYSELISESTMDLHLVPRIDAHQTLREFSLLVGPEAPVLDYFDWQGNRVHNFSIVGFHDHVVVWANSAVEIHPRRWRLEDLEDSFPVLKLDHRYHDYLLADGPIMSDVRLEHFAQEIGLLRESKARGAIAAVMAHLPGLLTLKKSPIEGHTFSVSEVLARGQGGAKDYAHVAIALLRLIGIPARYVSGYLSRRGAIETGTHAWVEAFVPSVGWLGLDPTHGQLIGDAHVALAIGRSHLDVPPQRGVFRGSAQQRVKTRIRIQDIEDGRHEAPFSFARVNNRVLIDLVLRDRNLSATSLRQQISQ